MADSIDKLDHFGPIYPPTDAEVAAIRAHVADQPDRDVLLEMLGVAS